MEDGVYFNLDEDKYHSLHRLSASGIKNITASTLEFWNSSWLNPYREEVNKSAFEEGKAYHTRILEGVDVFHHRYKKDFNHHDYPEALKTNDDIKSYLKTNGLPVSGAKSVLIKRIKAEGLRPKGGIIEDLKEEYYSYNADAVYIKKMLINDIEFAASIIEKHDQLNKCFKKGYPEVSILWTDEETSVKMKSRIDYLKIKAIIDYKTFANQYGRPIDRAMYQEMANYKYHIQGAVYDEAVKHAKLLIKKGDVHGRVNQNWLEEFIKIEEHGFIFVFQQKGKVPVAKGKSFTKGLVFESGYIAYREGLDRFKDCLERDDWIDYHPMDEFEDEQFPIYMMED